MLSLGVLEHFIEGPQDIVEEFSRTLKDHGILIISVPWINPLRRFKQILKLYRRTPSSSLEFYQYVFSFEEVRTMLERYNFELLFSTPYDPIKTFKDEFPWLKPILDKLVKLFQVRSQYTSKAVHVNHKRVGISSISLSRILRDILKVLILYLTLLTGHMRLYIAIKKGESIK